MFEVRLRQCFLQAFKPPERYRRTDIVNYSALFKNLVSSSAMTVDLSRVQWPILKTSFF